MRLGGRTEKLTKPGLQAEPRVEERVEERRSCRRKLYSSFLSLFLVQFCSFCWCFYFLQLNPLSRFPLIPNASVRVELELTRWEDWLWVEAQTHLKSVRVLSSRPSVTQEERRP